MLLLVVIFVGAHWVICWNGRLAGQKVQSKSTRKSHHHHRIYRSCARSVIKPKCNCGCKTLNEHNAQWMWAFVDESGNFSRMIMMMTRSTAALFCLTISRRRHCEIMHFLCIVHTNKVLKVYVLCFQVNVESTSAAENKSLSTLEEKSGRMKR